MNKLKILNIVGTRPNLMKMAPIMWEMKKYNAIEPVLIHTGQHYDKALSEVFFQQLDIPLPDFHLGVGSGSHSCQTAQVMISLEALIENLQPDLVLVVGDVNSTVAAALVAAKMQISIAHVEAGLRSFDRTMPEEINRVVIDSLARFLFITEASGMENLRREGVEIFLNGGKAFEEISGAVLDEIKCLNSGFFTNINASGGYYITATSNVKDRPSHNASPYRLSAIQTARLGAFVGNVMIDTLVAIKDIAEEEAKIDVPVKDYALLTLHRPSNVDIPKTFARIVSALSQVAREIPIIFPCHPRTRKQIYEFDLDGFFKPVEGSTSSILLDSTINLLEPVGYFEFLKLMGHAKLVLTDSGGIQEETTILGVPCLTLRENTERPVTIEDGTNTLVGTDPDLITSEAYAVLNGRGKKGKHPILWDGRAAERIVKILLEIGEANF